MTGILPGARPNWAERLLLQFARRVWLVVSVALLGLLTLSISGYRIALRLDEAHNVQHDNTTWMLVQTEVEMLKLQVALERSRSPDPPAEQIVQMRQLADVYLSRIALVSSYMANSPDYDAQSSGENWQTIIQRTQRLRTLVDADDTAFVENIPAIQALLTELRRPMRQFALTGLAMQNERSARDRAQLSVLLVRSALIALSLIVILLLTSGAMLFIARRLQTHFNHINRGNTNLERTLGASLDGVVVARQDGRIREANDVALAIFGLSREQMLASDFISLLLPAKLDDPQSEVQRWLLSGGAASQAPTHRFELEVRRRGGAPVPVELSLASGLDADNVPVWFAFMRDISDRWHHEQSLRDARDAAVEAAETKARFLAMMSHEMRTPLNGLIASLDLLASSPPLTERQKSFLDIADRSAGLALAQINDVLELTRLESGGGIEPAEVFNLTRLIREMADQVAPLAGQAKNEIRLDLPPDEAAWVRGARRSLLRVLMNLTGNALKFTAAGVITIRAGLEPSGPVGLTLRVQVVDTGIGIAAGRLSGVFDAFSPVQASYNRRTGGSGLGLGIVLRTVELMGGGVSVESEVGRGSIFGFEVPLMPAVAPTSDEAPAQVPSGGRASRGGQTALPHLTSEILIVEDNETNRIVLREMILHLGQRADEAASGPEAIVMAGRKAYDLIIMDVSMPGLDGLAATAAIRAPGGVSRAARIIALTAHGLPEEHRKFRALGLDEILTKPVTLTQLHRVLNDGAQPGDGDSGRGVIDAQVMGELRSLLSPETLYDLLQKFGIEVGSLLDGTGDLLGKYEYDELSGLAHKHQGACAVVGALRLAGHLETLAVALKQGDTLSARAAAVMAHEEWHDVRFWIMALQEQLFAVIEADKDAQVV